MTRKIQKFETLALKEQTLLGLSVGMGESFFPAMIMLLGCAPKYAGLAISVPIAIGSLSQLFFRKHNLSTHDSFLSLRKLILKHGSVLILASMVMVSFAWFKSPFILLLFCLLTSFYAYTNQKTSMVWGAWIVDQMGSKGCENFFFKRNTYSYLSILLGILAGGFLTKIGQIESHTAFAISLAVAGLTRFASGHFLKNIQNVGTIENDHLEKAISLTSEKQLDPKTTKGLIPLFAFVFLLTSSVHISSGFFAPYMLNRIGFSYFDYGLLTMAAFIARACSGRVLRHYFSRFGARSLMLIGAIAIVPTPLTWIYKTDLWFLILSQIYGGIFWAAFELGLALNLLRDFGQKQRMTALLFSNTASAMGILSGTSLGFLVANSFPSMSVETYTFIFLVSSFCRILPIALVPFLVDLKPKGRRFVLMFMSVRPSGFHALRLILWAKPVEPAKSFETNSKRDPRVAKEKF